MRALIKYPDDKPVLVFDGHCVLCSWSANFVIRHDPNSRYRLLAAQTELGEALYQHFGLKSGDYDTLLLVENGTVRIKSDAALAVLAGLGFPWALAGIFRIIPLPVRDWIYDCVAGNRIRLFGRRNVCYVACPDDSDRFL